MQKKGILDRTTHLPWCRSYEGREDDYEQSFDLIGKIYGHTALGLVVGVKMAVLAMNHIKVDRQKICIGAGAALEMQFPLSSDRSVKNEKHC